MRKRRPIGCHNGRHERWPGDAYYDERRARYVRRYPCCGDLLVLDHVLI